MAVDGPAPSRLLHLSPTEKLGYGVGDLGFNLYWTTLGSFLAAFYTDVFGLTAATAGTMLLVTKIVDAVTDPLMGALADRTDSRYGKFRPYLLFAGVPMALCATLTFTTPALSDRGKLLWAYGTYSLMMAAYTVLNIPYSALSAVLTAKSQERTSLVSLRFGFAFLGAYLVNRFTLPLVECFGGGEPSVGWQRTMSLYGGLATLTFIVTFLTTKERISPPRNQRTTPLRDVLDLIASKPWVVLFFLAMIVMLTITTRGGSSYYYLKYYVGRPDLISSYLGWQAAAYACGALVAPLLVRNFDKARVLVVLLTLVGMLSVGLYWVPPSQTTWVFGLNIAISFALGPKSPLTWSMYADTADYNERRTGRRATAMTFSAATFAQKLGGALGAASMLWVLGALGYAANQAQSGASSVGIVLLHSVVPGAFALIAAVVAHLYPLRAQDLEGNAD